MLLPLIVVILSLALLSWSADRFVYGAAGLARALGVSPLLIGLTVVAFGTSAPEILVSLIASLQGSPALAVGNAIGSNIANIALVLGASALVAPLMVSSRILRRELPILMAVVVLGLLLILDGRLGWWDGVILLGGLALLIGWLVREGLRAPDEGNGLAAEIEEELPPPMPLFRAVLWLGLGLLLLLGSSRALVWGAVEIATGLGVSELVIGLTIVAVGTSLPELATSLVAALKGENDLAIGNVIGSNLFNLLAVLGLPAVLAPSVLDPAVLFRDYPVMIGLTLLLFLMAWPRRRATGRVRRAEGALLLLLFAGYLALLGFTAT
jgi:cation:H+ antiporter